MSNMLIEIPISLDTNVENQKPPPRFRLKINIGNSSNTTQGKSMQRGTYSQEILGKEIDEIAIVVAKAMTEEVKQSARKIALEYFEDNTNADLDTLARASLYVALKEYRCDAEKSAKALTDNGGKKNRWWLYVVPLVERRLSRK